MRPPTATAIDRVLAQARRIPERWQATCPHLSDDDVRVVTALIEEALTPLRSHRAHAFEVKRAKAKGNLDGHGVIGNGRPIEVLLEPLLLLGARRPSTWPGACFSGMRRATGGAAS